MYSPGTHGESAEGRRKPRRFVIGPDERLVLIEPAESVEHPSPPQRGRKGQSGERDEEGKDDHDNRFRGNA
jgi:hypothetical protein